MRIGKAGQYMDRIDLSRLWQAGSSIGPRETLEWELGIGIG
jgi:hypothetical protein